jgi:outer membrane protein TolC
MFRIAAFGFWLLAVVAGSVWAQEAGFPAALSMNDAMIYALQYHPSVRVARAGVQSSDAAVTAAQSPYFPFLSASAGGTRTDGAFVFNPSFPPRIQSYNNYTASLQLQQTLYDFGKTGNRVEASQELAQAASVDFRATNDAVATNVCLAYLGVVQAKQIVVVNEQAVAQASAHLAQAKAFYSVGKRPQFDVIKSEVDLANANVALIKASNQFRVAKVQLENAMGIHPASPYILSDTLQTIPFTLTLDSAKAIALSERPDLIAAQARMRAGQSLATAVWRQHMPSLGLSGTWNWTSFVFPLRSRWNAGVTLTVPIFQGFSASAQFEQANAAYEATQASLDLLTETTLLEVEQTYLAMQEAEQRISATVKLIMQAEENLKSAEGRYNSGIGSAIEITDAQVTLSTARITRIQALYDYHSSFIRLQKAMGKTMVNQK